MDSETPRIVQLAVDAEGPDLGLDQLGGLWEASYSRERDDENGPLTVAWRRVEQRFEP